MKWNWKKFAFGAVTLTSALALAACSSSADKATESEAGDEKLIISVDTGYVDYIKSIEADFEKETGVKIEVKEEAMTDTLEKLSTDGPTGVAPDVMIAPYDRVGGLGSQVQIAQVTLGNEADYDETAKSLVTLDGTVYGAPAVVESLILYYNKDLLTEAPKTFADLTALQKEAKYAFAGEDGKSSRLSC